MHTFTKLILTGDSGAGKTTTAKHLVHLANIASSDVPVDMSNATRQGSFHKSTIYKNTTPVSAAILDAKVSSHVCLFDLRDENICQSLHYWLSFIDNACSTQRDDHTC